MLSEDDGGLELKERTGNGIEGLELTIRGLELRDVAGIIDEGDWN